MLRVLISVSVLHKLYQASGNKFPQHYYGAQGWHLYWFSSDGSVVWIATFEFNLQSDDYIEAQLLPLP